MNSRPLLALPACVVLTFLVIFLGVSVPMAHAQADYVYVNNEGVNTLDPLNDTPSASTSVMTGAAGAQQACALLQAQGLGTLQNAMDARFQNRSLLSGFSDSKLGAMVYAQGNDALSNALQSSCAMLSGQDSGTESGLLDAGSLQDMVYATAFSEGLAFLQSSGLPFTGQMEVSGNLFGRGSSGWEVLTVQPLWRDKAEQNHVFAQLSWNRTIDRAGYADGDTLNAGLAYRRLSEDRSVVYGLNAFVDHARERNHNRISIGADVQTAQLGVSANKYIPLSSWKSVDAYKEERAASGFDLELQGRLPEFPSWQANLTGYQWSSNEDMAQETTWGYDAGLQWQPVNGLIWEAGLRNEQAANPQFHATLRLVYKFGESVEKMWERPVALTDMRARVYDKVRRDNAMRVKQRIKQSAYVTVTQSIGANTAALESGAVALSMGAQLPRPFTVTVSGVIGSVARLAFQDGAVLTIGEGSQVRVEADVITLISGMFQYVSGSTNVVINIPGGTVTLLGTDIDVSTDGATSVLRVRDGSARLDGTTAGSVTLGVSEAAASVNGVVSGVLATSDPVYIAHTDDVSEKIDRVAAPQTGAKVAPYSYKAPEIIAAGNTVGDVIKIGVTFSTSVNVTGTPQLAFAINGNDRLADYSASDSTSTQLVFVYTLLAADAGATTLTTHSIGLNGGAITDGSKDAVTTMADTSLALPGPIQDDTPDAFAFTDVTDQALSTIITSNTVTISGIGPAPVAVSVTGDGSPQISIEGGAWAASGTIADGETLQVRLTSANALNTLRSATVTVGTVTADSWDVTTIADPCAVASPAPGTVCADGTVYAGLSPDGNVKMFTTPADAASTKTWNNGTVNWIETPLVNCGSAPACDNSGETNTTTLVAADSDSIAAGVQPHEAAKYCADLSAHGHSDWYLPSAPELNVIHGNKTAIGLFNISGSYYWSSSENNNGYAWSQRFSDGAQSSRLKNGGYLVRCARR